MERPFRIYKQIFLGAALLLACLFHCQGQENADATGLKKLLDQAGAWQKACTPEKIYLHFDKPYYAAGDTAWFKGYLTLSGSATASAKLYVELLNADGGLVKRLVLPVFGGLVMGYLPLDIKAVAEGSYTVRAYTNWQQNFGNGLFFYRQFNICAINSKSWLLTEQHKMDAADSDKVQLALRFQDTKGLPLVAQKLWVRVLDKTKVILKSEMTTTVDGSLNSSFTLPPKVSKRNLNISIEDAADKNRHLNYPLELNNGDPDLQFMPEGGSLIAGVYNRVGFKAIGTNGLGYDVSGAITDTKGTEVATFKALHGGMGSFVLVPQAGEAYTAKTMINGRVHQYPLPAYKPSGLALRVDAITHPDDLYVYISGNGAANQSYRLVTQTFDKICFGTTVSLNADGYCNLRIPKGKFPTGVVSVILLDMNGKPLGERRIFINRNDALKISAIASERVYAPHDSVAVMLKAAGIDGAPIQGNFSVAVTDDAQVKDTTQTDNIQSHMLLASELKGNIENPAWYFAKGDEKLKEKALDNLLLTQGWQGFDWGGVSAAVPEPAYTLEANNSVSGNLKNLFGKPAAGLKVQLLANGKQFFLQDTVSDKQGRFEFHDLPLSDSVAYLIKLHNKHDGSSAAGIQVNEFKPSVLKLPALPRRLPWNLNADTTLLNYLSKSRQRNQYDGGFTVPEGSKLLKQVEIKARRNVQDVNNELAIEIDSVSEKKLIAANKTSLFDVLEKELKGTLKESFMYSLKIGGSNDGRMTKTIDGRLVSDNMSTLRATRQFVIGSMRINDFIVDGQSLGLLTLSLRDQTSTPPDKGKTRWGNSQEEADNDFFARALSLLNMLGGEDVTSVKVMRGQFLSILITTRSGKGLTAAPSIGTYAYRPLPMQLPRQFYRPKYIVKDSQPDLRSTIHWEPNLLTDEKGNASLSFYAADKPGTYTVTVEGTDMQGHYGVSTNKITIAAAGRQPQ